MKLTRTRELHLPRPPRRSLAARLPARGLGVAHRRLARGLAAALAATGVAALAVTAS
jgi:hypothetical protein